MYLDADVSVSQPFLNKHNITFVLLGKNDVNNYDDVNAEN